MTVQCLYQNDPKDAAAVLGQRNACRRAANKLGWLIQQERICDASEGTPLLLRPDVQELLRDVEQGRFQVLVVASAEVLQCPEAKEEYAELLRNDTTRATIQQIRSYYDEFLGWANEFDLATIPRKRAILGQLIEKVEVGKGYKVTVHLRMSYAQFLGIEGNGEIQVRKDVCA